LPHSLQNLAAGEAVGHKPRPRLEIAHSGARLRPEAAIGLIFQEPERREPFL
jgi:hypothetical protein